MPINLRASIEREVRALMSRDARECAIADLILEHRAKESEFMWIHPGVSAIDRARELRELKGAR